MNEKKELKVLNLIIKQKYLDEIISGKKTEEYREVKPTTIKKLLQLDEDGYEIEDENGNSVPIIYDAIRFFAGYSKDRDSALVEVKDIRTEIFVDGDGNPIEFEIDDELWVAQQVVFELGKVIEKDLKSEQ